MADFRITHIKKTWPGGATEETFHVTRGKMPVQIYLPSKWYTDKDPMLLAHEKHGLFSNPYPTLEIAKAAIAALEYQPPKPTVTERVLDRDGKEVYTSSIDDDDPRIKGDPSPFAGGGMVIIAAALSALVMAFIHKTGGSIW